MSVYLSRVLEYAVPCLIFWGVLAVSVAYDRSRFRNCIYLLLAASSTVPLFCVMSGGHELGTARAFSILAFAALLTVPFVLIAEGPPFHQFVDHVRLCGFCGFYGLHAAASDHSPQEGF